MPQKNKNTPESAPDPETGETVHIGTEPELQWFDESNDDDDDAKTEELLEQLSNPARRRLLPWWQQRADNNSRDETPLDDDFAVEPRKETHVERLLRRRRAKAAFKEHFEAKKQQLAEAQIANSVVKNLAIWHNNILTSKDFSKASLFEGLAEQFKSTVTAIGASPTEIDALLRDLRQSLIPDGYETGEEVTPPTMAPELYKNRSDKQERPDAFIKRVYGDWIKEYGGFPRAVFDAIDPPLKTAISRYGLSDEVSRLLPKLSGRPRKKPSVDDAAILANKRAKDRDRAKRHRERHGL